MSVVVLAYHQIGCVALRTLLERGVDVAAVFTYRDAPGENCWFDSVADLAREAGLGVHFTESINDREHVETIRALNPDVIFSFHYRHLLRKRLLSLPRLGAINLHASLLPRYRGRCPINWQLIHGETESGVTLHHMVQRADAGDIIGQERVAVGPEDTALDLYRKLLPAGARLLARHIEGILAGSAPRVAQDESRAMVFGGRTPEDGRIDWDRSCREIHDLVRAVAPPWPGAFCGDGSMRVTIRRSRPAPDGLPRLPPGEVRVAGERVLVGTRDRLLELVDFETVAGRRLESGERLGGRVLSC